MSLAYRFEIIPRKFWKNVQTGQTASIYGAMPGGAGWEIVEDGFTFRDNQHNTVGSYGASNLRTEDEIETYLNKHHGAMWRMIKVDRT